MKIRKTFANHTPTPATIARIRALRAAFSLLADAIDEASPERSREKSLAHTHLEDSLMWAVKGW